MILVPGLSTRWSCRHTRRTRPPTILIPDVNFKNALVNTNSVDTNGDGQGDSNADTNNDGEIQLSEASAIIRLHISNNRYHSITMIPSKND